VVHKALDLGINFFDTADVYGNRGGSETLLGKTLGARRKDIFLATKFGLPMDDTGQLKGGSRRYVFAAIDASLDRLNTDWVDLYQLHRPDPFTPLEETLLALNELVKLGKVRHIGVSNLPAWQVVQALWIAKEHNLNGIISAQNEYNWACCRTFHSPAVFSPANINAMSRHRRAHGLPIHLILARVI